MVAILRRLGMESDTRKICGAFKAVNIFQWNEFAVSKKCNQLWKGIINLSWHQFELSHQINELVQILNFISHSVRFRK